MSTHALTIYASRESDGETSIEVGHFWRKLDGHPSGHGAELKRLVGPTKFQTLWELVGVVAAGLRKEVQGENYNWIFVPMDPHTMGDVHAEFIYRLSLVDRDGEMPRGGLCRGECDVHIVVQQLDNVIYDGLLKDYNPKDP